VKGRGRFEGVRTILQLNWPFYAVAGAVEVAAQFSVLLPQPWRTVGLAVALGTWWFTAASIFAAYLTYDASDLYRSGWLERALRGIARERMIDYQCGFDDASETMRARAGASEWIVLDHYDPERMTEASIRRARRLYPPEAGSQPTPFDKWPVESGSADVVFGFLAIHELRREEERAAWMAEAARCWRAGGVIVLAEHLRDFANFAAFGPGFLHFHSRATWERAWTRAGLRCVEEYSVTAWVRVFVLAPAAFTSAQQPTTMRAPGTRD
jgi:SAM-dependent methyltransferase